MTSRTGKRGPCDSAIWQEVEFGSYAADLPLWIELAEAAQGPVLELGAGAGRVAQRLAGQGHEVIAVDSDPQLTAELERTAEEAGFSLAAVTADLSAPSTFHPPAKPALVVGPLHVIQMLDAGARPALLGRLAELSTPEAIIALTVVDESTLLSAGTGATQILPDMRELDGWVYASESLWVQVGEDALTARRLRERVSPEGRMEREIHDEVLYRLPPDRLEEEAVSAGLRAAGRRQIGTGGNEADSTVVLLDAPS